MLRAACKRLSHKQNMQRLHVKSCKRLSERDYHISIT